MKQVGNFPTSLKFQLGWYIQFDALAQLKLESGM